jgi:hydroxymethylpyrimidine/phosphomethylpyrimidine kinase
MSEPCVLVLAGLDPSGAAGLLADAEAVKAAGARPLCVATAITVQTTREARKFEPLSAALVTEMAHALLAEEDVRSIKIGMIADAKIAKAIQELLRPRRDLPVVVDPVLQASSGLLLFKGALQAARDAYLMLAQNAVLTPNLPEAQILLDGPADAQALLAKGPRAVLLKGGHLPGDPVDLLAEAGGHIERFSAPRIHSKARGTGCRLASAIAAGLAQGASLRDAVVAAREVVRRHLESHTG